MFRKIFSSSFNHVRRVPQISSLASTISTPTPTTPQKRMILSTLKSTSDSCANVLSKIEREGGFQISRSDLNRWAKLFEKQGQTQKSLQILRFKQLKYLGLMNHFKLCSGKTSDPDYFGRSSLTTAASIIAPSVVNLTTPKGLYGSGVVFSEEGSIIACAHTFELSPRYRAKRIEVRVTTSLGQTFAGAVVDYDLDYDLALVKIESPVSLSPANFGLSKDLAVGDWVLSVGNPQEYSNTFSMGIVGCLKRSQDDLQVGGKCEFYLQTDCWLDEGSSGGALVNLEGEVVGLNCAHGNASVGVGFAIPIETVVNVMKKKKWLP